MGVKPRRPRSELEGRSVALSVDDMAKAAAALIDLDGWARRILLCPPGWGASQLAAAMRDAEADSIVHGADGDPPIPVEVAAPCRLPLQKLEWTREARRETEWILPTSGTSGPPKLVAHTLRTLTAAIAEAPLQQWATFYDIRRYGGLQYCSALSAAGVRFNSVPQGKVWIPSSSASARRRSPISLARRRTGVRS